MKIKETRTVQRGFSGSYRETRVIEADGITAHETDSVTQVEVDDNTPVSDWAVED